MRIRTSNSVLNQAIATLEKDVADSKRPVNERAQRRQLIDRIQIQRQQQYRFAAEALAAYLPRDKTNPELHMRLASVIFIDATPYAAASACQSGMTSPDSGPVPT